MAPSKSLRATRLIRLIEATLPWGDHAGCLPAQCQCTWEGL